MRISTVAASLLFACAAAVTPAAAQPAAKLTGLCTVADPTGTPLNVRASPQGQVIGTLGNGTRVQVTNRARDYKGQEWVYIAWQDGRGIGWVFFPYLTCPG